METLGEGLGTCGIWGAVAAICILSEVTVAAPILFIAAAIATVYIWSP